MYLWVVVVMLWGFATEHIDYVWKLSGGVYKL
jgi:hypothetical protein